MLDIIHDSKLFNKYVIRVQGDNDTKFLQGAYLIRKKKSYIRQFGQKGHIIYRWAICRPIGGYLYCMEDISIARGQIFHVHDVFQ